MTDAAAPPFRFTRESKIRIDREGRFWHEGERVEHPGLARGLASWIALDPATDRYILRNALDWCFITVDDAPIVVRSAHVLPNGTVQIDLSDGTHEMLQLATLRIDADDVPYCDTHEGTLPARFGRTAAFTLLEHAHPADDGIVVELGGRLHPVRRVERGEGAPHRRGTE